MNVKTQQRKQVKPVFLGTIFDLSMRIYWYTTPHSRSQSPLFLGHGVLKRGVGCKLSWVALGTKMTTPWQSSSKTFVFIHRLVQQNSICKNLHSEDTFLKRCISGDHFHPTKPGIIPVFKQKRKWVTVEGGQSFDAANQLETNIWLCI